jgi:hypothetical protein
MKLPSLKLDLKSFILDEKGGIQPNTLVSIGAVLGGLQILAFLIKSVKAASISAKHDHCDPGHSSETTVNQYCGWGCGHASHSSRMHSSADGSPTAHCSATSGHASYGASQVSTWQTSTGAHSSANAGHNNAVYLTYG